MKVLIKLVLFVAIVGGIAYFVATKKNSESTQSPLVTQVDSQEKNTLDSVLSKKIESGINKIKGGVDSEISKSDGDLLDKIGDKVKAGKESAEKAIASHETSTLTGKLVISISDDKRIFYLKTGFFEKYRIKTLTGLESSYDELTVYKGKKVKASGILNTETKEMTMVSCKLVDN